MLGHEPSIQLGENSRAYMAGTRFLFVQTFPTFYPKIQSGPVPKSSFCFAIPLREPQLKTQLNDLVSLPSPSSFTSFAFLKQSPQKSKTLWVILVILPLCTASQPPSLPPCRPTLSNPLSSGEWSQPALLYGVRADLVFRKHFQVISKLNVRYTGIFHSIDPTGQTVMLAEGEPRAVPLDKADWRQSTTMVPRTDKQASSFLAVTSA